MANWNGTKGNEFKVMPAEHIGCTIVYLGDFKGDIEFWHHQESKEVAIANAELTCDALITIQKCDLLPSELLDQRDELLIILEKMVKEFYHETATEYECNLCFEAKQLISKISPK